MRKVGNGLSRGLMQAMSQGFDDFKPLFTNKLVKFHSIISTENKSYSLVLRAQISNCPQRNGYFHILYALIVGIPPKALCALAILVKTIICDRKSAVAHRFNLQIK